EPRSAYISGRRSLVEPPRAPRPRFGGTTTGVESAAAAGSLSSAGSIYPFAQRLSAMLELQVALTAEREPQAMLDLLCRGAQEFMDCRCAAVAIFDAGGERFERCSSRGFGEDFDAQLLASDPKGGAMRRVVTSTEALRADNARDAQGLALPEFFPKVGNLLA